jgi:hypothetical protein
MYAPMDEENEEILVTEVTKVPAKAGKSKLLKATIYKVFNYTSSKGRDGSMILAALESGEEIGIYHNEPDYKIRTDVITVKAVGDYFEIVRDFETVFERDDRVFDSKARAAAKHGLTSFS